jgi:hypothetical protein
MNCSDCKGKLDEFVDRELNLDGCPPCAEHYEFQAHLKRLVKVSCDGDKVPAAFREKLRQILL